MKEQLNYHKLVNLRKRFDKYNCEYSEEIVSLIDNLIIRAKEESEDKRRENITEYRKRNHEEYKKYQFVYQNEKVECPTCNKLLLRKSLYIHMKNQHSDK